MSKVSARRFLTRVSELRAVSDSCRLQVLNILMAAPEESFSARQLAEQTGVRLTLMHYHLKILRDEKLVKVRVRRGVQGRSERQYRSAYATLRWDLPPE